MKGDWSCPLAFSYLSTLLLYRLSRLQRMVSYSGFLPMKRISFLLGLLLSKGYTFKSAFSVQSDGLAQRFSPLKRMVITHGFLTGTGW